METMYPGKVNSPATTLDGGINDSIQTIDLVDGSVLPDAPNIAVIGTEEDAETILYETKIANQLTDVTRGFQGTAKAWDSGTTIRRTFTEYDYAKLKQNIEEALGEGNLNLIGIAGNAGFGVGICPPYKLPVGMSPMAGTYDIFDKNYGNYQYADGSIMVWIPKFYYRINHVDNPTHAAFAPNDIDIKGIDIYATTAKANADVYALHRAFIDGGVEKDGVFVDKYKISKNAWGTGYIGSSLKNGLPISTHAIHNPIADLTACGGNYYYEMIKAAHARDGVDGAENPNSIFFSMSVFVEKALAMLSLAHAQASTSTTYCAWYDATYNYPKGCNDNALGDTDDATVEYVSDGYTNCGKTGSGTPFAKTTHNGQECGVADLNGLIKEISIGATCIATTMAITGASQADPCVITVANTATLTTGDMIVITAVVGMTQLNNKLYKITVINGTTFSLDDIDSTGYTAYGSAGTITYGTFYVAKFATAMKDFDSGNGGATDHWGATGCAAMMDALSAATVASMFKSGNAFTMRYGSGTNQVLDEAVSGEDWVKTGLGAVKSGAAVDGTGTNQFGRDYYYQYIRNELCLLSCGYWNDTTIAGVWSINWTSSRTTSHSTVGGRFACYPE